MAKELKTIERDVIVPAAQLFIMVADLINAHTITVPNVGLADGMINIMTDRIFKKKTK